MRGQHEREFSFRDHQTLKQSQWKCRVCTFIFMRERAVIEEHLMEAHGLTIEGYEGGRRRKTKSVGNNGGEKKFQGSPNDNDELEPDPHDREQEKNAVDQDDEGGNIVPEERSLMMANEEPSENPIEANDPKAATESANNGKEQQEKLVSVKEEMSVERPWFDGCTFQCPMCPGLFRLTSSIVRHMNSAHDASFVHSKVELAEVSYWKCEICKGATFMKRMRMDIKYHLKVRHNMSLADYEREFLSGIAREERPANDSSSKTSLDAQNDSTAMAPPSDGGSCESKASASKRKRSESEKATRDVDQSRTELTPKAKEATEGKRGRGRPKSAKVSSIT